MFCSEAAARRAAWGGRLANFQVRSAGTPTQEVAARPPAPNILLYGILVRGRLRGPLHGYSHSYDLGYGRALTRRRFLSLTPGASCASRCPRLHAPRRSIPSALKVPRRSESGAIGQYADAGAKPSPMRLPSSRRATPPEAPDGFTEVARSPGAAGVCWFKANSAF